QAVRKITSSRSFGSRTPLARKSPPRTLKRLSSDGWCANVEKIRSGVPSETRVFDKISATSGGGSTTGGILGTAPDTLDLLDSDSSESLLGCQSLGVPLN